MATVTTLAYKDVKTVMTKSSLPVGGYSVNPYVGCPHACRYCYASFMKRFTGHTEKWGTFLDVKNWPRITDPHKYDGQRIVIGSVTDGYNEHEATYRRTRMLLEQLRGTSAEIMVTTKSDLVLRDIDLLKTFPKVTVSWSVNTLDEAFKDDMDDAPSIERRLSAMKTFHDEGIRTVCFVSPIPRHHGCSGHYRSGKGPGRPHLVGKPQSPWPVQGRYHAVHRRQIPAACSAIRRNL